MKKFPIAICLVASFVSGLCTAAAQNLDVDILKGINPAHPNSTYWKGTSGSVFFLPPAIGLGQLGYGLIAHDSVSVHNAIELFGNIAISTVLSEAIKIAVNRQRPADKYPGIIFASSPTHGHSFPSGHSVLAFTTATTLALEYRKWYITVPAFLWAGSVSYSRLYLGKHYPSDALAGDLLGVGSGLLTHWLNKKIFTKR